MTAREPHNSQEDTKRQLSFVSFQTRDIESTLLHEIGGTGTVTL